MPGLISIGVAWLWGAFAKSPRVPLPSVMNVGLMFEVVSCYGIALAEYLEPTRLNFKWLARAVVGRACGRSCSPW